MKAFLRITSFVFLFFLVSVSLKAQEIRKMEELRGSFNYGKSVAVFGGSVSVIPPSDSAKVQWEKYLNLKITNYGVPGAGFSSLQGKSLQKQVDEAGVFDIYILWASTNDYTNNRAVGEYTDYTELDGYDEQKLITQAGGINYCIKKIYEKNPDATIYFFTSSKAFVNRGAHDPSVEIGMSRFVENQKKICALHGIPVLDQFTLAGFNTYNQDKFYRDPIHMNYLGYKKLGELQVSFLAFPK
ncbi:GDSL-like Lipase/Acylhydrolase family [Algoriphagus alkaliphilus]|uniref:GDSL-like Lipase/Acylhydrolase family n=1 Tax=Algoriphagus alkaliphilus TaxID=279824 RepID=A0A1G5VU81_9BACT|nr:SGNH/GDSL hydrolase family protein [Algoriphagus alkaliphilus]SDA49460.1 GDSL-like Lipase/Acylhydrolase family [Algoriphagus alkaliphilus]